MATLSKLRIELTAGTAGFTRGMKAVGASIDRTKKRVKTFATSFTNLGNIMRAVLGAAAIRMVARWTKSLTDAFAVQETALADLESSLKSAGIVGAANLKLITDEASRLQKVTTAADEAIIAATATLAKLAPSLNVRELRDAQRAIVGLADTFFKGDVENAALIMGKTLGSTTNALIRYGIVIENNAAPASQKLADILGNNAIQASFAGAEAKAKTFGGRMTQLSNALGDTREVLGGLIVNSLGLTDAIGRSGGLIDQIEEMTGSVVGFTGPIEIFIAEISALVRTVTNTVQIAFGFVASFILDAAAVAMMGVELLIDTVNRLPGVDLVPILSSDEILAASRLIKDGMVRDAQDIVDAWTFVATGFSAVATRGPVIAAPDALAGIEKWAVDMSNLAETTLDLSLNLDKVAVSVGSNLRPSLRKATDQMERLRDAGIDFADGFARAIIDSTDSGIEAFRRFADSVIRELARIQLTRFFTSILSGGATQVGVGTTAGVANPMAFPTVGAAVGPSTGAFSVPATIVNQSISFNLSAIDGRDMSRALREQAPEIVRIVGEGARSSSAVRRQLRGGR